MSLAKWKKRYNHYTCENGCIVVYCGPGEPGYTDLFHLTDYKVSTVGGSVVYLREIA